VFVALAIIVRPHEKIDRLFSKRGPMDCPIHPCANPDRLINHHSSQIHEVNL
jgi:hypothetical protein